MSEIKNEKLKGFSKRNNTFIKEKVADSARRIELEIGDVKKPDRFIPQVKTKHWDNETNFSVRLKDSDYDSGTLKNTKKLGKDTIEWERAGRKARIYELDGYEDGGFEFEVELAEKPQSNVLEFTLESKEFNFYYQPELTEKEKAEGASRPENVVGSYAVYHKTKANNRVGGKHYRIGKAFHIYRPWAEDTKGQSTWCELSIDDGLMTVTVPQEFLDKAVYPVLIDPTFGYESVGGTSQSFPVYRAGSEFTAPENGEITAITTYHDSGTPYENGELRSAVYDTSNKIVGQSDANTTAYSGFDFPLWIENSFSSTASISNLTDYILVTATADDSIEDSALSFFYDSGSTGQGYEKEETYPFTDTTFPDPITWDTNNNKKYSIYATYTASASTRRVFNIS